MAVALTTFTTRLAPYVLGCPVPVLEEAIRDACIEFCERSLYVNEVLDPVDAVAGQIDYDLEASTGTVVTKIMRAWFKGTTLSPFPSHQSSVDLFDPIYAGVSVSSGSPQCLFQKNETTFSVLPAPEETVANAFTMVVATKPARTATSVDDSLFSTWLDAVMNGAKARLMTTPGVGYENQKLAIQSRLAFERDISRARRIAEHGLVRSQLRVRAQPFV